MTQEQLNRGEKIQEEIQFIKEDISNQEIALTKSTIPFGRKLEKLNCFEDDTSFECESVEYRGFLESLIKTRKDKIKELEQEFEKL